MNLKKFDGKNVKVVEQTEKHIPALLICIRSQTITTVLRQLHFPAVHGLMLLT